MVQFHSGQRWSRLRTTGRTHQSSCRRRFQKVGRQAGTATICARNRLGESGPARLQRGRSIVRFNGDPASAILRAVAEILYLDQNAWVSLARGAWDKASYPQDHARLVKVIEGLQQERLIAPLSFANIYETSKINDPVRRANMAQTQVTISRGRVFRGRRRILGETLAASRR